MTQKNTDYFTKTAYLKPTFQISKYTTEQQTFLTLFNFPHSQIKKQEIEQLADLLLKRPMVSATSKFEVGKIRSPLHPPPKPDANFKKSSHTFTRQSKKTFRYPRTV